MEQAKQDKQTEVLEDVIENEVEDAQLEEVESTEENEGDSEEESKIENLEKELAQLNDRFIRVQADYDNFRRRTKQEKEAAAKYRAQSLIEQMIPAIDNFDRALGMKAESEEAKSLLQGMEMVYRQLTDALKSEGLEVIEAVGQSFDPHYHQAVMQIEDDQYESNQVVEELQKGYKLKDRVIRPSMVKVNQ